MSDVIIGYTGAVAAFKGMVEKCERLRTIVKFLNNHINIISDIKDPKEINRLHDELNQALADVAHVNLLISTIKKNWKRKSK